MEDTVDNLTKKQLAEHLNEEFKEAVFPVTTFMGLECVLGFFGNLIVLYVFLFHYHVCNYRYFVLSLAFIDILSTLTTMPAEIVTLLNWYLFNLRGMCKVKSFLNMFTISAEALCLLTIAFDRYRKVYKPFRWQIKQQTSIFICCANYSIALLVSLPGPFLCGLQSHPIKYRNTIINVTICEKDERLKETIYPLVYTLSLEAIMSACFLVMIVLYFLVAKTLIKLKQNSKNSRSPIVVGTTPSDTSVTSHVYSADMASSISDTGYSNKTVSATGEKNDVVTSADKSEIKKTGSNLKVSSKISRNATPVHNVEMKGSRGKQKKDSRKKEYITKVQRKTLIMFILTLSFIATMLLYVIFLSLIAKADNILHKMTHAGKSVYFFFFRLYFLNHVINPLVYGLLDPRFRKATRKIFCANRLFAKSVK